jgi:hypothetical protein
MLKLATNHAVLARLAGPMEPRASHCVGVQPTRHRQWLGPPKEQTCMDPMCIIVGGGVEKGLVLPYRVTVLQGTELARMGRLCASVGNNRPRVDLHRHGLPWSEGASFKSAPDHTYVVRHQTDICSFTPPAMPESLVDQLACCPPRPPRPPRPPTIDRPSISAYMIVHKGSSTTAWRGALQVAAGGGCQEGGVHCSEAPPKNVPDVYE